MASAPDQPVPGATLPFGVLGRPHGVRGELVLHPFNPGGTHPRQLRLPVAVDLIAGGQRRSAKLVSARPLGEGEALVRFEGVDSRDAAAALTHAELQVPRAALPPLAIGEIYIADLIGCSVYDVAGRPRGRVTASFWNGSQDVLTVVGEDGAELLVPAVPGFIQSVDLAARTVVIDDHE
jgi:16S rRNA processing protein RimM